MQKFTSRRFLITVLAIMFQFAPLLMPSDPERKQLAQQAMLAVTVIAVVSIAGLNIEDWLWAKKAFKGVPAVEAALDAMNPEDKKVPAPLVQSNAWPLVAILALSYLIMRIS